MPKGGSKNKRKSAGGEVLSTLEKKAAGIKREKVGLATPSPTPTTVAASKGTLAAIPEVFSITFGGDIEGYRTVESDSDSDSTSSAVSVVFDVGGDSGGKGKDKENSDDESDDGSRFLAETMREGWQEMVALCGKMTDAVEGCMVGFLLSVVSTVCRMEPSQVVRLCCGLVDDCAAVGMDTIEMEAREVCSLADDYEIKKSQLDDKRQEVGDLEEDVKELKKTIAKLEMEAHEMKVKFGFLEGEVKFQKRMREEDRKNLGTKREGLTGPHWRDVACQATPVGVDKSVSVVAPVVDRKARDVAVQAAVPILVSTSGVQTDGQGEAEATPKPSYASVATPSTLVPTGPRNGTSGGPVPPAGGAAPHPVGARALVVHGVPTRMSVDEIFWHADRFRIAVGVRVVRARWLVGLDSRRGKRASSLVLYFNGVVPVRGRVVRFGGRWCPVDRHELARKSVPSVYTPVVRGDCVCSFSVFFGFPLDAGVGRLPAMALGGMRGYVT